MRQGLMRTFGARLRVRIKEAGYSNLSVLLAKIGIGTSLITAIKRGAQHDVGMVKVAKIAIMLGQRPSELMAEIDELLLNPDPLAAETVRSLGFRHPPESYDLFRLALVLDVVMGWDEEMNDSLDQPRLIELTDALYDEFVRPDRSVTPLKLRQRAMARVFGVDLPAPDTPPRGRGRPPSSAAA